MGLGDACTIMHGIDYFSCSGGVTEDEIAKAEEMLSTRFSNDFRAYLLEVGCAEYYAHELCGLGGQERLDVVTSTLKARESNPSIPTNLYVIEDVHMDGVLFMQKSDGTVYEVTPEPEFTPVFSSLADYVEKTRL